MYHIYMHTSLIITELSLGFQLSVFGRCLIFSRSYPKQILLQLSQFLSGLYFKVLLQTNLSDAIKKV